MEQVQDVMRVCNVDEPMMADVKLPPALNPCFIPTYRKASVQLQASDLSAFQHKHPPYVDLCPSVCLSVTSRVTLALNPCFTALPAKTPTVS